ncbi:hypothetical protein AUP68_16553 [Ilyonectria robusta]
MSVSTTAGLDLGPATDASDPLESANDGVPLFQTQRRTWECWDSWDPYPWLWPLHQ